MLQHCDMSPLAASGGALRTRAPCHFALHHIGKET
jgi:hypothetical protein